MAIFPIFLMVFQDRLPLIKKIGPVIICYAVGILTSLILPHAVSIKTSEMLTEATVPLAIPLMLFCLNLKAWIRLAPRTLLSFLFSLLSIAICAIIFAIPFKGLPELWKMSGMLVGVYTGGTPNMSAIGLSLDVSKETFVILNTSDIFLSSIYLFFILGVGKKVFSKFLPAFQSQQSETSENHMSFEKCTRDMVISLVLAICIVGVSAGISLLFFGKLELPVVLLGLTAFGMVASLNSKIRNLKGSFTMGEYFLYVFCLAIGSMTDLEKLLGIDPQILIYCTVTFFGALILHFLLNHLAKIDADTAVITNVSAIYGPAFVPPVAKALGNPEIIISGLTCGLVGYGVGNYLGLAVAYIVKAIIS